MTLTLPKPFYPVDQGAILFTDLPPAAREKLANREKIRDHLNSLENLMNDDQGLL